MSAATPIVGVVGEMPQREAWPSFLPAESFDEAVPLAGLHKCEVGAATRAPRESVEALVLMNDRRGTDTFVVARRDDAAILDDHLGPALRAVIARKRADLPVDALSDDAWAALRAKHTDAPTALPYPPRPVERVMREVKGLLTVGRSDAAQRTLWLAVDDALRARDVEWCARLLTEALTDLDHLDSFTIVSLLTATRAAMEALAPQREALYQRGCDALIERGRDAASVHRVMDRAFQP